MASPPLQGRARIVQKPRSDMRGPKVVGPLVRLGYESADDVAARARANVAQYVDEHPELRPGAYTAANALGVGAGVARGGYHAAKGLADTAVFAGRLLVPQVDELLGRKTAMEEVLDAGANTARYVARGVQNPQSVGNDLRSAVEGAKVALVPSASPVAPNTSDELARRLNIGMNQGEVAFNIATTAVGGPLSRPLGKAGEMMAVRQVPAAKYIAQGYSPKFAAYLAEPYPARGMGSHWAPRRLNLPPWFENSAYNKLAPTGIQRGEMYELHGPNDLSFNGAKPPKWANGEAWKFSKSGLKKNGLLGRIWNGAPGPTKAVAGGLGATAGSGFYAIEQERDR